MDYAIVEASGKQFWVETGKYYDFNYIDSKPGTRISLLRVFLFSSDGNVLIGKPCLKNVSVEAVVLGHLRDKKVTVYKMRSKKKTRKKKGHRTELTRVMITSIST